MRKKITIVLNIIAVLLILSFLFTMDERELKEIKRYCSDIDMEQKVIEFCEERDTQTGDEYFVNSVDVILSYESIYKSLKNITKIYMESKQQNEIIDMLKQTISEEEMNRFLNYVEFYPNDYFYLPLISDDILNMYE